MKEYLVNKGRKIKNAKCIICLAVATLMLFAGCSGFKATETERPTETADNPDFSRKPGQEERYVHSHPVGTTVRYDLNGDGIGENITVNAHEYEPGKLSIGNATAEFWSATPTGYFTILNPNGARNMLLVGVSDYGPSDDNQTTLYAYDGKTIIEVGFFDDIIGKNVYDHKGAVCHGDGTITARTRLDVLGTWNATCCYYVNETGVWDITDFYQYEDWDGNQTGWEVTAKVGLIMYEDRDEPDNRTVVPAGTSMRMTGICNGNSSDVHWAAFLVGTEGRTLWLSTEKVDWYTCVQTEKGLLASEEAFDGFYYAG